jgi:hypothetical protein
VKAAEFVAMGCLILVFALLSPRLALIATAILTDVLSRSMGGWLVPFVGFLVLPWTTLAFAWMWESGDAVRGIEWFLVGFAFLVDVGFSSNGRRYSRRRDD